MGENRVAAGDIFFGVNGVEFVFDFVAFRRDGEKADAVYGAGGRSQFGNCGAEMEPGEIDDIEKNNERDDREKNAANGEKIGGRCGGRRSGHTWLSLQG